MVAGALNPGIPTGSREGADAEQLQQHEKISREEAKELRQVKNLGKISG